MKNTKFRIRFIHGDIRSPEDLADIKNIDLIIDASAEPSVLAEIHSSPLPVIQNNLIGAVNILELAKRCDAKLVFLSTSRVYSIGQLNNIIWSEEPTRFKISENQVMNGVSEYGINEELQTSGSRSFYGATKLASELFIEEYGNFAGVDYIINRCGVVIAGPGQMGKADQGVVSLWAARHFWNSPLKYIGFGGSGKQLRNILHIDDLSSLIMHQIKNFDQLKGNLFNVGGGRDNAISLVELTTLCQKVTRNTVPIGKEVFDREADVRCYATDNQKVNSMTGWSPKKSVEVIVKDIVDWLSANKNDLEFVLKKD
jgi:CDP-paratose 2-epimerase